MHKKKYVFLPYGIAEVGGAELYMLNKKRWLEDKGWEVYIISAAYTRGSYRIKELDKYRKDNLPILRYAPFLCSSNLVNKVIGRMIDILGDDICDSEIVIESHMGSTALWGELLAKRINGKNIIVLINESFDEIAYQNRKDYFYFKYGRKELFGGHRAHALLFSGYDKYSPELPIQTFKIIEKPVQDINNDKLNAIGVKDWTICYIGRTAKSYFPSIVEDVNRFAADNNNKTIQFVIVGDIGSRREFINSTIKNSKNLQIVALGDMFPIPKKLFSLIDVCIAGSGSAKAAAYEGVKTIIADPDINSSTGVLGYDTIRAVGWDGHSKRMSFYDALVEVLINDSYNGKEFLMPPPPSIDAAFSQNMELLSSSARSKEYYSTEKIMGYDSNSVSRLKTYMAYYTPNILFPIIDIRNQHIKNTDSQ